MPGRYSPKHFTLVEVIVVVFVCLFVTAVVIPAGNKSSSIAFRIVCGTNLSGLGKAMLIYSNDYDDEFPRAGGRSTIWSSQMPDWTADSRYEAYGINSRGEGGEATISSSLYLLVKYTEVTPRSFICPGDTGTTEFNPADYEVVGKGLVELWDFGPEPYKHCSYAYHMPYGLYALTVSNEPGMAVLADRNPWMDSPAAAAKDFFGLYNPEGPREAVKAGNAIAHEEEGQNVLFMDSHVNFETSSCCGINDDNIYTNWDGGDIRLGGVPVPQASEAQDRLDSFLVHDPPPPRETIVTKQPKEVNSIDLERTSVVATLDNPIPEYRNVIWCSTFQMAWDGLKENIIGEPVQVLGAEEMAARLNEAEVSETDLDEESFYAAAGLVDYGILEKIREEMASRFPSEPSPVFDESYSTMPDAVVTYSYLDVDIEFNYPFYVNNNAFAFKDSNGIYTDVTSFCTYLDEWNSDSQQVHEQVDVLYYKRDEFLDDAEFAIDLCKNSSPYQIVLARVPQCGTLGETVAFVEEKVAEFRNSPNYWTLHVFYPPGFILGDSLRVPDILYKLTHNFAELEGRFLANPQWQDYSIIEARQVVNFAPSRIGVVPTSQATSGVHPILPRNFHFNKPFLVYVKKRQGEANPFFVMWVDNAELMKEFFTENDQ